MKVYKDLKSKDPKIKLSDAMPIAAKSYKKWQNSLTHNLGISRI